MKHLAYRMRTASIAAMMLATSILAFGQAAAPTIVEAHGNQPCYDSSQRSDLLSGITYDPSNTDETGVYATIDFHHDNCGDNNSAVSSWVALVPENGMGQIVQVGITQCSEALNIHWATDPCYNTPNQLRYFFAYGGCTVLNGPYAQDGGPATDGGHAYKVEHQFGSNPGWLMTWPTGSAFISAGNVAVSCFQNDEMNAQYVTEKWDRGDSSGGSTSKTHFANEEHRNGGSNTWYYVNATSGNCQFIAQTAPHTSYCTKAGAEMYMWD